LFAIAAAAHNIIAAVTTLFTLTIISPLLRVFIDQTAGMRFRVRHRQRTDSRAASHSGDTDGNGQTSQNSKKAMRMNRSMPLRGHSIDS
jgi:UPF0716 family protein affecting phage T7 exclusion